MSLDSALARIGDIQRQVAPVAPTPAPLSPLAAAPPVATAATGFAAHLGRQDAAGIPLAAYRAAPPVQNGQLVEALFAPRRQGAEQIAGRFGLRITSAYRTPAHNRDVGGVPNSFHTRGLAFDFVGTGAQMEQARAWAQRHPEIFQEALVHDVGSGPHLHLAFRSGR